MLSLGIKRNFQVIYVYIFFTPVIKIKSDIVATTTTFLRPHFCRQTESFSGKAQSSLAWNSEDFRFYIIS